MVVYFNGKNVNKETLTNYEDDLQLITNKYNKFVLCGDLNARYRHWNCIKANSAGNTLFKMVRWTKLFVHTPTNPTF